MAPKADNNKEKLQDKGMEWQNVLCSVDLHRPQRPEEDGGNASPDFDESDWEPGRCCR